MEFNLVLIYADYYEIDQRCIQLKFVFPGGDVLLTYYYYSNNSSNNNNFWCRCAPRSIK